MGLIIPKDYNPFLSLRQTQKAVKIIKDVFEIELSKLLNLEKKNLMMLFLPRCLFIKTAV